ncbi:DUF1835 domain-containing protein [Longimicrobium sp.]|uniref:DUF1835 domain-containing protein n=1 Tax=Longimicrobium sp. TaxID=2029185 RepID=UPI003B3A3DD6
MLHVTNGDSAAERIRAAGVEGPILPWRDVLHDGPVPPGLPLEALSEVRAGFIASRGWGAADEVRASFAERDRTLAASRDEDEVVLWFEHDLYDQLQLIQLLDWCAAHPHPRLTLINPAEYLGMMDAARIRELFDDRATVTPEQLALGRRAWDAFRAPDPRGLEAVIAGGGDAMPHLPAALFRLLEEYPAVGNGLSRSQEQILIAFAGGPSTLREAYPASHHQVEDAIWMGDGSFAGLVQALASGPTPLLAFEDDGDGADGGPGAAMDRRAALTDAGREVLSGGADAVRMNGIDRWIGGVHLSGRDARWRWDADEERLVEAG